MAIAARRIPSLALAALCALSVPRLAHARGASDAKRTARHLLAVGAARYKARDFHAALEAFQKAYAAFPSSKILFNIAQAYRELDEPDLASDAFAGFLERSAEDVHVEARRIQEARSALKELAPHVVHVRVDVNPSTAELTLDGNRKVRASFYLKHKTDDDLVAKHHLSATAPGFAPGSTDFTLADVAVLDKSGKGISITLAPQATVVQKTTVVEKPGAATLIPVPEPANQPAPREPVVLAPTSTPSAPAQEPQRSAPPQVTPSATELAQTQPSSPAPPAGAVSQQARPHGRHTASFIAWGIGGAFAAGAIVVGSIALGQNHTDAGHQKAVIADALWGCTAAAAITGGVLWFAVPGDGGSGGEVGVAGHF